MALRLNISLLCLSIVLLGFSTFIYGQKTYSRSCQCEKTVNGQCAYTLLLPVSGGGDENGVCPPTSTGGGSTEGVEESLQELSQNISALQLWTGEQAKTLITLQNSLAEQRTLIADLAVNTDQKADNSSCDQCDSLGARLDSQQEEIQNLVDTIAQQSQGIDSVTKTAQESLDSVLTSQEQLLEANTRISELVRVTTTLEEQLNDLRAVTSVCSRRGLLVSGEEVTIPDTSITSSSIFDETHTPVRGRINTSPDDTASGAWCPREPNEEEWIQFDLGSPRVIYGVVTRGRADYTQWVTTYQLQYGDVVADGEEVEWNTYTDILGQDQVFPGNSDQNSLQTNMLWQTITAQMIRLVPLAAYQDSNKCMRADLIGCIDNS